MAKARGKAKGEDAEVVFAIFGRKLTVSPGRVEYNRLRSRFLALAREQADAARNSIAEFKDHPGALFVDGLAWARPYFAKAADLAVEELLQRGCFDLDAEVYFKEHIDLSPWERGFGPASKEYKGVVEAERQREAEREERTDEAGSSWVGGGFGLSGAIKGAIEAEAMNFASAAISDTFNAIGRKKSKKENAKKLQDIFERRKNEIVDGVFETIACAADSLVSCCNEHGIKIEGAVSPEDVVRADRMCSNLKTGKIPAKMVADVKMDILAANPYSRDFYEYVYISDGDASGELEKVAAFFGISLDGMKKEAFKSRLGECPSEMEEEVKAYREKAVSLAAELRYDAAEELAKIDEQLAELDRNAKTVGERTFATREEAAKQRELAEMIAAVDISNEEAAKRSKADIEQNAKKLKVDCTWQMGRIESALKRFDENARTVENKMFATREEAEKQRTLADFERELDISTEAAANSSLSALDSKISELGIDGGWKRERVAAAVSRFEHMACVAFGKAYPTRDEARAARGSEARFFEGIDLVARQSGSKAIMAGIAIPEKKASGAVANLGVAPGERIICAVDTSPVSFFMHMKTGLVLTSIGIRWKNASTATTRTFISWRDFAAMPLPTAVGKIIDFGGGALFENGGLIGAPTSEILAVLQRVAGFCREATFMVK